MLFCECRRPADPSAGLAGHVEAGARAFTDESSFVFRERACELVEHASQGGRGVDSFVEAAELDAARMKIVKGGNEVDERASETVDAYDYERVSASQAAITFGPFRAFHGGAAGMFDVDGVTSGGAEILDLGGWILVCCAHSRVSGNAHGHNRIGLVVAMSLFWPGFLDCCSGEYVVFPAHMAKIGRF